MSVNRCSPFTREEENRHGRMNRQVYLGLFSGKYFCTHFPHIFKIIISNEGSRAGDTLVFRIARKQETEESHKGKKASCTAQHWSSVYRPKCGSQWQLLQASCTKFLAATNFKYLYFKNTNKWKPRFTVEKILRYYHFNRGASIYGH